MVPTGALHEYYPRREPWAIHTHRCKHSRRPHDREGNVCVVLTTTAEGDGAGTHTPNGNDDADPGQRSLPRAARHSHHPEDLELHDFLGRLEEEGRLAVRERYDGALRHLSAVEQERLFRLRYGLAHASEALQEAH